MNDPLKSLHKVIMGGGIVVILIGVLAIWKGVTDVLPSLGMPYGGMFLLCGVAFVVIGLVMVLVPARKERKKDPEKEDKTP